MLNYHSNLNRDPALALFVPNLGHYANVHAPGDRDKLIAALTSVQGVNRLIGAILSAPSRPPVVAVESLIFETLGVNAFSLESKKMIGRVVRQIVEQLGGRWVRRGTKTTGQSRFNRGSIYTF